MAKTEDSLFDEIVETRIAPDGTVEASLKHDTEEDMKDALADMLRIWKDFKDANGDYPSRSGDTDGGNACATSRSRRIA